MNTRTTLIFKEPKRW